MATQQQHTDGIEDAVSKRKGGGKRDDAPSLSWFYGDEMRKDKDVAARLDARLLYRWREFYWEMQTEAREESRAFAWLKQVAPNKTSAAQAKELAKSAVLDARPMPERKAADVVIPLRNAYLHLEQLALPPADGDEGGSIYHGFKVAPPSRDEWITYGVDCALKDAKPGTFCNPAPQLEGSLFGKFLATTQPDPSVRAYLQEYCGYTLLPDTRHQTALVFYGSGANGKSMLTRIMTALHRKTASIDLDRIDGFQIEDAIDASLIVVDEAPEKGVRTDRLKKLISGETVKIDRKFQSVVSTALTAKWIICTNHKLKVSDQTHGFWRRLVMIPWTVTIPDSDVIVNLDRQIIETELDLVLEWALEGLLRLLDRGRLPPEPDAVRDLKEEVMTETDSVRAWMKDVRVELVANAASPKKDVFKHYERYCEDANVHAVGKSKFWERVYRMMPGAKETDRQKTERINGAIKRTEVVGLRVEDVQDMNEDEEKDVPF